MNAIRAASVSIPLSRFLERSRRGTVLTTFARSAYLGLDGSIVAVVASELMNGPLNVVLDDPAPRFEELAVGAAAGASDERLLVEDWPAISLQGATQWDPQIRPWSSAQLTGVSAHLDTLGRSVLADAPTDHLAHPRIEQGLAGLQAAVRTQTPEDLTAAASDLAGLGGGLTPTGDDVLVGVLMALAALPDGPNRALRAAIRGGTVGRTTRISDAYLEAAARGEASEAWQRLLAALGGDGSHSVIQAGRRILSFGETSGVDMLTGFLLAMQGLTAGHTGRAMSRPAVRGRQVRLDVSEWRSRV